MKETRTCLWIIVFLSVLSLQTASADCPPIDKEPDAKDTAQLAKQLWVHLLLRRCPIPPRRYLSRWFAEPLSVSYQIAYGRQLSD